MSSTDMIQQVIAIASGKGGVGKSTLAVNLAYSLKKAGYLAGLLDADIYGPSFPTLLGISTDQKVVHDEEKKMEPIMAYGIPTMSIGYLIDEQSPAVWRGPMASKGLQQLFYATQWGKLDYLIVDLPPGTGDIPLTLAQRLPLSSVLIITTPQQVALADVKKAISMFKKLNIPLLGIVENMSNYLCSHCHHISPLFGESGGLRLAEEYSLPLLEALPVDIQISAQSDQGKPIVLAQPETHTSALYNRIAKKLIEHTTGKKKFKLPPVVVE
jgi:ATP-binding protein involved in chromosome partitioning